MGFSIGFVVNSGYIHGYAKELVVSGTTLQVPALGIGPISDGKAQDAGPSVNNLRINLESPLSSTLTANLKNLTTGNSLGAISIAAGSVTGYYSGGLSASQGDAFAVLLSVSGSQEVLSGIQWYTF